MHFRISPAPHVKPTTSVSKVMLQVLLALVPATFATVWYFGWGIIVQMVIGIVFALAAETLMLLWRDRPLKPFLSDYTAVITAVLLAFAIPPTAPWWLIAIGVTFAIIFAKHLYGGLGYNPFNPAMAGYVVLLVSFPQEMAIWLAPEQLVPESDQLGFLQTVITILGGAFPDAVNIDTITAATPLDAMRTDLGNNRTVQEIRQSPLFGDFGGVGWEWIGNYIAIGGAWLMYRRVIRWQIPLAVILGVGIPAFLFYALDPGSHASAPFHVFSGATLMCAFFIATDPVTAPSSDKARLAYGFGIGVLIYIIRSWGGYPDAVAFAVLLMNMAVPLLDHYIKPRTYGHAR